MKEDHEIADAACQMVAHDLKRITAFINSKGLLHFDAHFHNILTDGQQLFLTDFGLALSSQFNLSASELKFFKNHYFYDHYSSMTNFLHCIVTSLYGKDSWEKFLNTWTDERNLSVFPPFATLLINRYAGLAVRMDEFYQALHQTKKTPYPKQALARLYSSGMKAS